MRLSSSLLGVVPVDNVWLLVAACLLLTFLAYRLVRFLQARSHIPGLHKRHVFVTGCDTGFGRLIATRLDAMGVPVFAACYTAAGAEDLTSVTSERLKTIILDVTKDEDIARAAKEIRAALPGSQGLWGLVNNAGVLGSLGVAEMMTRNHFRGPIEVNLMGLTQVTRTFLPMVRRERGRIVNTLSIAGTVPVGPAPYVASKFAAMGYTQVLRMELIAQHVSVHSIEPWGYNTNLLDNRAVYNSMDRTFKESPAYLQRMYGEEYINKHMKGLDIVKRHFMKGHPSEVADACVHALFSRRPRDSYVVGAMGKLLVWPACYVPMWLRDWFFHLFIIAPVNSDPYMESEE